MLQLVIWIANIVLVWTIIWRGVHHRMLQRYWIFFIYLLYLGVLSSTGLAVYGWFGYTSLEFYWFSSLSNLGYPFFHCAILWGIYLEIQPQRPSTKQIAFLLGLIGLLSAPILANWPAMTGEPFNLFHATTLPIQALLCGLLAIALINRPEVRLGKNLSGIFFGLSTLILLESLHHYNFLYGIVSFEIFRYVVPLTYTGVLAFFLVSLWEPSRIEVVEETRQLNENLQVAIRQLLRSIFAR